MHVLVPVPSSLCGTGCSDSDSSGHEAVDLLIATVALSAELPLYPRDGVDSRANAATRFGDGSRADCSDDPDAVDSRHAVGRYGEN